MKKAAVYTRTGDKGTTGLVGGTRINKSDSRIKLYGDVDELNSHLGLAITFLDKNFSELDFLKKIQIHLFDIGSHIACEKEKRELFKIPKISADIILELERKIDEMDEMLPPLKYFILPGGSQAAAAFHICRTVCRRVEREFIGFTAHSPDDLANEVLVYLNRLSDYFFILSRLVNKLSNNDEIFWIPEKK